MPQAPKQYRPHPPKDRDAYRGTAAQRGYDQQWLRLAEQHIEHSPLCAWCLKRGISNAGTAKRRNHVDHKRPFKGLDDPLRLDPSNLQTLCHRCHVIKTHRDNPSHANR
jgi:5-methylcytosine-specific restriction protein A